MLRRILILTIAVAIVLAIGQEAEADWLNGWDKRIKLTIDHNDITSSLSNFPVLIHLSNSSGRNSDDVSCVFDELTSNANRKKIAVTKSNGTTQCYIEIEKWDDANEQAWLWVKVSGTGSISRSVDTDLYLYYDKDQTDNTSYVGDSGSTRARNVWDSSSKMVQHLDETDIDGGSGDIKDSTSNGNNGTTKNMNASDQVPGQIDGSFDFDGSNDFVDLGDVLDMGTQSFSVGAWIKIKGPGSSVYGGKIINKGLTGSGTPRNAGYALRLWPDNRLEVMLVDSVEAAFRYSLSTILNNNQWYYLVFTVDKTSNISKLFVDGQGDNSRSITGMGSLNTNIPLAIGALDRGIYEPVPANRTTEFFNGVIDEVRISNTTRSAAWIKASYESGRDHLLDFGGEEVASNAIFFGINF